MGYRILLIDDETDILEFVKYNLERDGYEVYTVPRVSKRPSRSNPT